MLTGEPKAQMSPFPIAIHAGIPSQMIARKFKSDVYSPLSLTWDSGEDERSFQKEAERHSGMIPNTVEA